MTIKEVYGTQNEGKTNFDDIYTQPDPRSYFSTLQPLRYVIPEQAKSIFQALQKNVGNGRSEDEITVLDVGCSYGINGALLKYDFSMSDLYGHYCSPEVDHLGPSDILSRDRDMLESRPQNEDVRVIGLDTSEEAVHYAMEAGYLDKGIVANLEQEELTSKEAEVIENADMIISTGCVGYVTEKTFSSLLDSFETRPIPWVASFVLRMFPYDSIARTLEEIGLVTEKLLKPEFVQRTFESDEEKFHVIEQLKEMEIDPAGKEAEGKYYANFFLSRPEKVVEENPLAEILIRKVASEPRAMLFEPERIN